MKSFDINKKEDIEQMEIAINIEVAKVREAIENADNLGKYFIGKQDSPIGKKYKEFQRALDSAYEIIDDFVNKYKIEV